MNRLHRTGSPGVLVSNANAGLEETAILLKLRRAEKRPAKSTKTGE